MTSYLLCGEGGEIISKITLSEGQYLIEEPVPVQEPVTETVEESVPSPIPKKLPREGSIMRIAYDAASQLGEFNIDDLSRKLRYFSREQTMQVAKRLCNRGYIVRIGGKRTGHYRMAEASE